MKKACHHCGHALADEHRFCARCGTPAPEPADPMQSTAERPVVPATVPAAQPPSQSPSPLRPARYPLFADELQPGATPTPPSPRQESVTQTVPAGGGPGESVGTIPLLGVEPDVPGEPGGSAGGARSALPWLLGALALALVASIGTLLMLSGGDGDRGDDIAEPAGEQPAEPDDGGAGEPGTGGSDGKGGKPDDKQRSKPQKGTPVDVARQAAVTVPATAPPNEDVDGNQVRYEGGNMLDGIPSTAWRMPDSAAGERVVVELREKTRLTQVGIINGYAKASGGMDWYEGNRRIRKVVWIFDGDKRITQKLDDVRELQTMKIKPVKTEKVRIRITRVSTPGAGPASRNYTAISDVSLLGTPV